MSTISGWNELAVWLSATVIEGGGGGESNIESPFHDPTLMDNFHFIFFPPFPSIFREGKGKVARRENKTGMEMNHERRRTLKLSRGRHGSFPFLRNENWTASRFTFWQLDLFTEAWRIQFRAGFLYTWNAQERWRLNLIPRGVNWEHDSRESV